jgi:3-oxoacid CoA-transferase subunit A
MLVDASRVLGMVIGGPGTTSIGCLGAAQLDRFGNINSTTLVPSGGRFLVGSGGGNDVASRADECVVVTRAGTNRLVDESAYVTSPGRNVRTVCTDLGVLRRHDDELWLAAVPHGDDPLDVRVKAMVDACGWSLQVERDVTELEPVRMDEVSALRRFDPERLFLA